MEGIFRRRRLPHWDIADATYFVTACLANSLPARGLLDLRNYRDELELRSRPSSMNESDWEIHKQKLIFARFDGWIDQSPTARHLEQPTLAAIVQNALFHFAGERYWLLAYCVMPSHYHWVFKPNPDWADVACREDRSRTPRERIMHSIQSFTANRCNEVLNRSGVFWQDETYDHRVRDEAELLRVITYVEQNPVKAKLVERPDQWQWSSGYDRLHSGIAWGDPLPRLS